MTRTQNPNGTCRYTDETGKVVLKASKRKYDQYHTYTFTGGWSDGTSTISFGKTITSAWREFHTGTFPVTEA
jgi:hypothetical protein